MESIAFDGMCRCCASEGVFKDLRSAYEWMGEVEVYADMIEECFNISMSMVENVNNGGICEVCITQLRNASNFKKQVQQTEGKFLKKIQDGQMTSNELKIEMTKDEPDDSYDATASDNEFFDPEYDIPIKNIKIEKEEAAKPKKRAAKASTSRAKKAKADDDAEPAAKRVSSKNEAKDAEPSKKNVSRVLKRSDDLNDQPPEKGDELGKHRTNIRQILLFSNATPIRSSGDVGYACCFCDASFHDPAELKTHTIEEHDEKTKEKFMHRKNLFSYVVKLDITGLQCNICNVSIPSIEKLIIHLQEDHKKCLFTDIKSHIFPFKFEYDILRCVECLRVFRNFKALLEHMNVHYRNFLCKICDAGFVNKSTLGNHVKSHEIGSFKCDYCPKVFDLYRKKKSHEKSVHILLNLRCKCGFCNMKFTHYISKRKHMAEMHGVKLDTYACKACDKKFISNRGLTTHTKRDHLLERPYECKICGMKFFVSHVLNDHMVKHTGLKNFVCNVCNKAFGRKNTLRIHSRIHADDRRFPCDHCGTRFLHKYSLQGHLRSKHNQDL